MTARHDSVLRIIPDNTFAHYCVFRTALIYSGNPCITPTNIILKYTILYEHTGSLYIDPRTTRAEAGTCRIPSVVMAPTADTFVKAALKDNTPPTRIPRF